MSTPNWFKQLFENIDKMDTDGFVSVLTDDAIFKFGNAEAVIGKPAIGEAIAGFFSSIKAISHEILDTWELPGTVICRGNVTYTRHDSSQLTVPFANIFKIENDMVKEYLIYADISSLYS